MNVGEKGEGWTDQGSEIEAVVEVQLLCRRRSRLVASAHLVTLKKDLGSPSFAVSGD